MRPIRLDALSPEQLRELDELYHGTRDVRVRTRARMILLAAERGMAAAEIAAIVRQDEETVRRWFARYLAEGIGGPFRRAAVGRAAQGHRGVPGTPAAGRTLPASGAGPALLALDRGTPRGPPGGNDRGAHERAERLPPPA